MPNYLAAFWDPDSPAAALEADNLLQRSLRKHSFTATHFIGEGFFLVDLAQESPQSALIPLNKPSGELIGAACGAVFEGDPLIGSPRKIEAISGTPSRHYVREFVTRYWGSYVLFIKQRTGITLLADPLSSVPCFYGRLGPLMIAFSNLESLDLPDPFRFSINYEFLAALLVYDKIQTGETGLREFRELCAGEMIQIRQDTEYRETIWNPSRIASDSFEDNAFDNSKKLRQVVDETVLARASVYKKIVVNLSGGLDSSIVMGSLSQMPRARHCQALHHILDSRDPAEVRFARDLCAHIGCDLSEVHLQARITLPAPDTHPRTARPFREFTAGSARELLGAGLPENTEAIFTGQGGDHLFLATNSPLGVADFIKQRGFSSRLSEELLSSAKLSGRSVWGVVGEATTNLLRPPRSTMLRAFEAREALALELGIPPVDGEKLWPSWAVTTNSLPPGKFQQVSLLPHLVHLRDNMNRYGGAELVHPLLSQPILELCLRIPVYTLCPGGVSRGLARAAFGDRLPDSVRQRMTKGHAGMYFSEILETNQGMLIRELLNGELVKCGLLSADRLRTFLMEGRYRTTRAGNRLLVIYAIECWLRAWSKA